MKNSYFILIILFSFSLLQAENINSSKGLEKIKSNIVIQPNQKAKLENNQEYWDIDTLITYDSFGEPSDRVLKKYDLKGNMVEERSEFYNGYNTPNWSLNRLDTYTYDDQNRVLTEKYEYGSGYSQDKLYEYEYDDEDYDVIMKVYYKSGSFSLSETNYTTSSVQEGTGYKVVERWNFKESTSSYDIKTITVYDLNDNLLSHKQQKMDYGGYRDQMETAHEYDNQNRLIKTTRKSWHSSTQEEYLDEIYVYIYHHDNCLAEEHLARNTRPSGSGSNYSQIFINAYTYDENNNLKSERRYRSQNDGELFEHYSPLSYSDYAEFYTDYKIDYVFENGNLTEELRSNYYYDYDNPTEYEIEYNYRYLYEYDSKGNLLTKFEQTYGLEYDEYEDEWSYTYATKTHYEYDDFGNSIYSWYEYFQKNSGGGGVVSAPKKPRNPKSSAKMSSPQDDENWERSSADLNIIVGGQVLMELSYVYDYHATFVDRNNIVLINAKEGHKGAAYFDGSAVVQAAANPTAFTNTMTMAAWVKYNSSIGNKTIASWQCGAGNMAYFSLENNQLVFRTWENVNSLSLVVGSTEFLSVDTWYHVAVSLDAGVATLYINGEDVTQTNAVVFADLGTATHFAVGSAPEGNIDLFKGYMDNLSLWSDAKTSSEVLSLFKEIKGDEDNLVLALNFDHSLSILPTDAIIQFEGIEPQYVMLDSYAATFNGIDQTLSPETSAPFGSDFTISGWFKADAGDVRTIASWASSSDESVANTFAVGADNKLHYTQIASGVTKSAVSEKSIENEIWYHVALVKDNNQVKFYLNGELDSLVTQNIDNNQSGDNFHIGSLYQNGVASQLWKGAMDNLCFYTEARSAAEVLEDFQFGADLLAESLWAYWNFDDKNEIVVDAKNNHHILAGSKELTKSILIYTDVTTNNELMRNRTDHAVNVVGKGTHLNVNTDFFDNDLSIYPGNKLTVYGKIDFSPSSLTLKSGQEGTATLIAMQNTMATVEQYVKNDKPLYLGIPLKNVETSYTTGVNQMFEYDNWSNEWSETNYSYPGRGLLVHPEQDTDKISFTGNINSGNEYIMCWEDDERYALMANPYPSYLTWSDYFSRSKELEGNVWLSLSKNDNQVIGTYNGEVGTHGAGNTIVPFQSFWVRVQEHSLNAEVKLSNDIRSHYDEAIHSNKLLRAPQEQYPLARITVSDGTLDDETILYFKDNHSDGWDEKDAGKKMMNSDNPEIWTLIYDEPYAINALETVPYNIEQELGFSTTKAGDFTISAANFTGFDTDDMLMLYDKEADNKATNIATKSYSFSSDAVNTTDRFTIKFAPGFATDYKDIDMSKYVAVYAKDSRIVVDIKLNMEDAHAHIYNISGQKLVSEKLVANHTTLSSKLTTGVYLVVVENMNERVNKRIILK